MKAGPRWPDDQISKSGEVKPWPSNKRPVAWRVKDYADGWIIFQNENDANVYAASTGALMQGLYVRDGS